MAPAGGPGPVQEHRNGGGHDRGAYGDEGDLPAGHAAGDNDLHGGRWCHGPAAAHGGHGEGERGRGGRGGGGQQGGGQCGQGADQTADGAEWAGAVHGDLLVVVAGVGLAGGGHWSLAVWAWSWARSRRAWRAARRRRRSAPLGTAGGPGQREQALGGALRLGAREPLAVQVVAELGELVHDGHLLPGGGGLVVVLHCRGPGRAVTIRSRAQDRHRIRLGVKAVLALGTGSGAGAGRRRGRGPVVDGPVTGQPGLGFGGLLRRLRDEAGLTQDELAAAAAVSQRAISDLERGINATARKDTAVLLAGALGLDGPARELFVAAARGRAPADKALAAAEGAAGAGSAAAATRTLPRDIAAFTGRQAELGRLMAQWAEAAADGGVVGIHAIGGMAGIGKTTFAVHAAHRLAGSFPDGQFFLPLHAHTPGQRPVSPADATAATVHSAT